VRSGLTELRERNGYAVWERRTDGPLLVLALLFVVVLGLPLVADLPHWARIVLAVANLVIWGAFALDYLARLYLAPRRWEFVRRHPLDLLIIVVPFLRPLRLARLLRLLRLGAVAGVAQRRSTSVHARVSAYVATTAAIVTVVASFLMYDAERNAPNGNIKSLPDALWWAVTTITTVGYGDRYPTTVEGRLIAVGLMVVGIALLGVITATIAAWFVSRIRQVESSEARTQATLSDVLEELRRINARLDLMERNEPSN
jgi:voltage-gated potassium channel